MNVLDWSVDVILAAYMQYYAFVKAAYPDLAAANKIYTLDHDLRFTEAVQGIANGKAVQLYVPDKTRQPYVYRVRVDLLASSIDKALELADPLTKALAFDSREGKPETDYESQHAAGPSYGLIRVFFPFTSR